jgi:nicotinamide phosphoribosyltransferase
MSTQNKTLDKLNKTFKINPLYEADGYKVGHPLMIINDTSREYWTWIPRSLKYMPKGINQIMSAGQQLTWRYIHSTFQENFFDQPIDVARKFVKDMSKYLMLPYDFSGFEKLHNLGYLPVRIKALEEGTFTDPNIPHMTGINTVDGYAWLGLFLETLVSKLSWQCPTTATIGHQFKKNAVEYVKKTDPENLWLADFMCHDFHSRGGNPFTSIAAGLGHAFSNSGSDTLNVIPASRYYYDFDEDEMPIFSVNASEHSVTCTGIFYYEYKLKNGKLNHEIEWYYSFDLPSVGSVENPDYLAIAECLNLSDWLNMFPVGLLSVVSDTMDLWKLITHVLPRLKDLIMGRDGKLVIRPDSGDPVDITCGKLSIVEFGSEEYWDLYIDRESFEFVHNNVFYKFDGKLLQDLFDEYGEEANYVTRTIDELLKHNVIEQLKQQPSIEESKGVVELLYDIFGGETTSTGYKRLDSHIGMIYGDSINLERQVAIYDRLDRKGFSSTNVVVGVGSYTYVMLTRDSAGYAAKGAWFEVIEEGERIAFDIYKDPITDDGTKRSLKGFCKVDRVIGSHGMSPIFVKTQCTEEEENTGLLMVIYEDGKFYNQTTLDEIRKRVKVQ